METETPDLDKILTEKQKRRFYLPNRNARAGECHICGSWQEKLYPELMSVCFSCLKKLRSRGDVRVIRIEKGFRKTCDWCNSFSGSHGISGTYYVLNPLICLNCMKRLANMDTKNRYRKEREKVERRANKGLRKITIIHR